MIVVHSVNIMVAILLVGVSCIIYAILKYAYDEMKDD
ncbi:hypothetical protein PHM2_224 [Prochlorococcus phage P-HM2]|uniref:Uncharacterized protein n=1 Tax=Prochlorococcus phage P-HM2 TaxID=445696 RepID=E3ST74_9CAUD|nr:hypothetical protein PHM2_224 [Prochlorococcus phage P-HM2]ADP00003.1 hypothetical protein PHM2_224 [Prochlorococcus phage P-HM2]